MPAPPRTALAVAIVLATFVFASVGNASTRAGPRVRMVGQAPLTLQGSGFLAGEKVELTIRLRGAKHRLHAIAGPRGSFTRRLDVNRRRCDPLSVSARGTRGSRTAWRLETIQCADRSADTTAT